MTTSTTFFAKAQGKAGELYIYDSIGGGFFSEGVTAQSVAEAIASLKGVTSLDVYVNSPGGQVFEGVAIYNQLRRFPGAVNVHVDGIAASIASVIAMAGQRIVMAENAMMMIHNPMGVCMGTSEEMRKTADAMDQVRSVIIDTYVNRTKQKATDIGSWLDAETWMDAKQCVDRGFADAITDDKMVTASAETLQLLNKFRNTPEALKKPPVASAEVAHRARAASMAMRTRSLVPGAGPQPA